MGRFSSLIAIGTLRGKKSWVFKRALSFLQGKTSCSFAFGSESLGRFESFGNIPAKLQSPETAFADESCLACVSFILGRQIPWAVESKAELPDLRLY